MEATALFAGTTVIVTLGLMPLVLVGLRQLQALDHPNERSAHAQPTPRGGGVGPWLATVIVLTSGLVLGAEVRIAVIVAGIAFGLLGLVEDLRGIPAIYRFSAQAIFAFGTVALLGLLDTSLPWWPVVVMVAVLWIAAYVNAFNFMDGINGISGIQGLIGGAALGLMGLRIGDATLGIHAAVIGGAAVGFLPFNFPRARVFLGDSGSYFFGSYLAVLVPLGLQAGLPMEAVIAPVLLYLTDTGVTLTRRMLRGEPLHQPHREHTYQRLTKLGWSHLQVSLLVALLVCLHTALGYAAIESPPASRSLGVIGLVAIAVGYLLVPGAVAKRRAGTKP